MKSSRYITLFFIAATLILSVILIRNKILQKKSEYNSTTVFNRIENIQEMALVKYNYAGVIGFSDTMKIMNLGIPFTEKYFLLKYNGYVKAGIDLKDAKVDVKGESVTVTLPESKIMDTVIDEKSIKIFDESRNPLNPTSIAEYNRAIIKEKNTMVKDALNQGILKNVSKQATLVISGILKDMGFKKIVIKQVQVKVITVPKNH